MALFRYRQRTQQLLGDVTVARFNPGDLDSYINSARSQIAGESECIRVYATLAITSSAQQYAFTAITFPVGTTGVAGVINVRMVTFALGNGQVMLTPREWEFFNTFVLSQQLPNDAQGNPMGSQPSVWTQYGQGLNGTLFVNLPDQGYTLSLDTVCYPSALANDTDPEAIPQFFTEAIPYYAAYLALLTAQNAEGAATMLGLYRQRLANARQHANPSVLPHQWSQAPDPVMANRLGMQIVKPDAK